MNKQIFFAVVCAFSLSVFALPAFAVTIDYSSSSIGQINLNPADGCGGGAVGCFDFTPGNSLEISSGTAAGFTGSIDGVFGVGAITPSGGGLLETASVSGTGILTIFDGLNSLTASLSWIDIGTFGVAGVLNISGNVNLTSITYGGSNADLLALANVGSGTQTATFQFASPSSLTDIFETSTSVASTSFSGSINAVPVPAAVWLFGSGLIGLVAVARRRTL